MWLKPGSLMHMYSLAMMRAVSKNMMVEQKFRGLIF